MSFKTRELLEKFVNTLQDVQVPLTLTMVHETIPYISNKDSLKELIKTVRPQK